MATTTTLPIAKPKGGAFLLEQRQPQEVFTPEDFTDEHRAIGRTTAEFFAKEVAPHLDAIQYEDKGLAVGILRKSGELGLTGVIVPDKPSEGGGIAEPHQAGSGDGGGRTESHDEVVDEGLAAGTGKGAIAVEDHVDIHVADQKNLSRAARFGSCHPLKLPVK